MALPRKVYSPSSLFTTLPPLRTNQLVSVAFPRLQLQNTIFSVLLTSTIPPLAPFQCSFIKTPLFHYLNVTTSPHSTPSYHTHPHHSFFTKVLTYLLHTHSHRPFTSSPCPYISFNHQYIYPSNTRTNYQLLSILSSPLYYKLSLSSISILNRTPPPKYLILYPLHPHLATHRNNHTPTHMSSHILQLILSLRPNYLILSLKCVVYHIIHHFHTPLTTKYFLVSTYLFLPLGSNIATNHGLGWCDTTLLNLSIPSFISPQIPSPHTPPFQYLRTPSILHNTPYHHHSLSNKLSNLPIISYSYHPLPPNHYPYISSNPQYIYPINPLIQTLIYQLPSISFTLIYYKLTLSSLSTIHRILTLKNLIFYPITKYSLHAHYDTHLTNHIPIKKSYYTLLLSSSHPSNHLILYLPCKLYHTPHHSNTSSNKKYFSNSSYIKPHYLVPTSLFLLLGGDIEMNPGPINHLIRNYPPDHKQRSRTYFTSATIQLKPEYQHLSLSFDPHFITTHPNHQTTQQTHPFLHRFLTQHNQYAPPLLLYTLIVTISPLPT
jgi:hypothetical protein